MYSLIHQDYAPRSGEFTPSDSIALTPVQAKFQKALALHQNGQSGLAQEIYQEILKVQPKHADALHLLGVVALQTGHYQQAVDWIGRATEVSPASAVFHCNRGNALLELRRFEEAIASYDRALALKADYSDALNNRGLALQRCGRFEHALESYDRALAINPNLVDVIYNRGIYLKELGQRAEALTCYDHALSIKPNYAMGHIHRGNLLKEMGRLEEALASFGRAIKIAPNFSQALNNHGIVLKELGRFDDALASYDRALELNPDYADVLYNRGNLLSKMLRFEEAARSFERCVAVAPNYGFVKGQLLHSKMLCCNWEGVPELADSIEKDVLARKKSATPFGYQGISHSEKALRACAEIYAAASFPKKNIQLRTQKIPRHNKIRIGYLSGEFGNQATSILMAELFELHDKARFEIFAFDNGWNDRSPLRTRIVKAFDEIIPISRMSDLDVARLIHAKEIDILVNLNGYFGDGRQGVYGYRPSPIQVNYLGFPGTLGTDSMDYLIADRTVIPETSQSFYSEKIVYLPNSYQANDGKRPVAGHEFSREECGLPGEGFVFCCFNNSYKITPETFAGWMRILANVEGSMLWLIEDSAIASANLRKNAQALGINAQRIIFAKRLPLPRHLARHRVADLFLDTLPYNAHTTASDALWAGLPLLTCMGQTFPGRVVASLLWAIDVPELITTSQEEYETLAIELANSPERLQGIQLKLERNRLTAPLFNAQLFAKHIEAAYTQIFERCQAGLSPGRIDVECHADACRPCG